MMIPPPAPETVWTQQTQPYDCAEMAARGVIAAVTGHIYSETRIDTAAEKLGVYDPAIGTYTDDIPTLLKHYHVKSHRAAYTVSALQHVAATHWVIAAVDARVLWGWTTTFNGTDHAVIVESVSATTVTVVDSGQPYGRHEIVPRARFEKAFDDQVVVTRTRR